MRLRFRCLTALALASAWALPAHGQREPPAAPPGNEPAPAPDPPAALSPPRLLTPVDLTLPEGATVTSPIEVLLTIDSTGLVTEVTLTQSYGETVDNVIIEAQVTGRFDDHVRSEEHTSELQSQ